MNISILHLSDLHIKDGQNEISERLRNISNAVKEFAIESKLLIIAVTGDISYSGKSSEYAIAGLFLSNLAMEIKKHNPSLNIEYVIVPGNHDCNIELHTTTRDTIIDKLPEKIGGKYERENLQDSSIIDQCTVVQKEYFEWLESFLNTKHVYSEKLYLTKEFSVNNTYLIRFHCFNTAWITRDVNSHQNILFPLSLIPEKNNRKVEVAISLLHHPYNWLLAERSRRFKNEIERISNIIITGHEHEAMFYEQRSFTGERNQYMEGGALQCEGVESCFNLLFIDLKARKQKYYQYHWNNGKYIPRIPNVEWVDIPRSRLLEQDKFVLSDSFYERLIDPGTLYKHPNKDDLSLRDIYVYPDLEIREPKPEKQIITDKEVPKYILKNKYILVIGPETCGKTSLLKITFLDFLEQNIIPLYIDGREIVSAQSEKLEKLIRTNFIEQYSGDPEDYSQLDKEKKVLLIDDINKSSLGVKGKKNLLEYISKRYERMIFTSSDMFELEQLITEDISELLLEFKHCVIQEFGKYSTNELIERWYTLGREDTVDEVKLAQQVKFAEDTIDTIIGPNLMPSYPFFLITITQSCEQTKIGVISLSAEAGSFGYYYEWLITSALSTTEQIYRDLNTKYSYLAELAYFMFLKGENILPEGVVLEFHEQFRRQHAFREIDLPFMPLMSDLMNASIVRHHNGCFEFKYKYIYFYFVARAMDIRLQNPETREETKKNIIKLTDYIREEDCAYVLIFLSYKSQDPFVRNAILEHSKGILKDKGPSDLEKDVKFINSMNISATFLLPDTEPKEVKKGDLRREDKLSRVKKREEESEEEEDEKFRELILPIEDGTRTVQVIGQILKNFVGSLYGVDKYQMAKECYLLGLRIIKYALGLMEQSLPDFKDQLKQYIKHRDEKKYADKKEWQKKGKTESQLEIEASAISFIYAERYIYLSMKNISRSVGLEKLELVFDNVLKEYEELISVALIDVAIKLESFSHMPTPEIMILSDKLEKNNIILTVLRHLVWNRMRLYGCERRERQKLCNRLGIPIGDPRLLMSRGRKVSGKR